MVLVFEFPLKLALLVTMLYIVCKFFCEEPCSLGFSLKNIKLQPYLYLLFFMFPLILAASVRSDFLYIYPKVKNIDFINGYSRQPILWKLFYEISYGFDFISIELFFRGFLVLGFVRFA